MKSGCMGADRNYTKPISHSDLNNQTEQSSRSCQQAQIPSLKGLVPCIISRERLRFYSLLGKLRCDQKQGKHSHFMESKHVLSFKVLQPLQLLLLPSSSAGWFLLASGKLSIPLTGLKDSLLEQEDTYCPTLPKFITLT